MVKHKHAQVTQTFTFLAAALIIGALLLFGGYSVTKLINNVEQIEDLQFKNDLEQKISSVSSKYGSVDIITLRGLEDFDRLCAFDYDLFDESTDISVLQNYPLIRGELRDNTSNIFLINNESFQGFSNNKITIEDPYFDCRNITFSGTIDVRLEGLGKKAKLTLLNSTS